ncbi:MAG: hypothetical protein IAF02_01390 [Anaerolineae bacterium]|nr:hypothetical protein [Anaerolineae bacterium]
MDALMLAIVFSGLCLVSTFGTGLFILAACIQAARINKSEGIDEVHFTVLPVSKSSDSLTPQFADSLS